MCESRQPNEPAGTPFYDNASQRRMKYVVEGPWKGWIIYQHADGHWVTLRKATDEDIIALNEAVSRAHHEEDE